jgi:streptogramin lyase
MSDLASRARLAAGVVVLLSAGLVPFSSRALAAVGDITEYPIPNTNAAPAGITPGPDGNLWFTEQAGNMVAKITTSGVVTEYTVPTANASPSGIVAGPDGNLWFTEYYGNKVARVTTSGVITEYGVPTTNANPSGIAAGPDGNLWFTEYNGNKVARVTRGGAITEFSVPTLAGSPSGIAAGPDGNLWFTEFTGNNVAKMTTAGAFTEFPVTTGSSPLGIAAGPDGNLWFTENDPNFGNNVASVTTSGVVVEYTIPFAGSLPGGITSGPDGNLWFTEGQGNNVARMTTAGDFTEYPLPNANGYPVGIAAGADRNIWFTEGGGDIPANKVAKIHPPCPAATTVRSTQTASSTTQYSLQGSDGVTWQDLDAASLSMTCTPTVDQSVLLTANSDLFTGTPGYNQDLGIFVSVNGGSDELLAWKESGGFAGTYSPNAAYIQTLYDMFSSQTYVFKLKWKTNKGAPAEATIYAGAGATPGPISQTSLVAKTFPSGATPNFAVSTTQYSLANSNGATWQDIDATNLVTTVAPPSASTAALGANADLFTGNAGYNQDIGIFVSDNGGADTLVAWKESGGFAGTYSPNAAFVKATYAMTGGHSYVFKLKWKTNKDAIGKTIYAAAGAGPAPWSHTSLLAETIATGANPYTAASVGQYSLPNSTGTTWQLMDSNLNVPVIPSANTNSIVGVNVDLFTGAAGYNQDIGIFVTDNGGAETMLAWKESGGFAGTYSPNAAFVQGTYEMAATHTYVFKLRWKTNKDAPGATIYAGAGPGPTPWSNTRVTVELTN